MHKIFREKDIQRMEALSIMRLHHRNEQWLSHQTHRADTFIHISGCSRLMANGDYWGLMGITLIPNGD